MKILKNTKGYTLIETLITVSVFGIIIVSITAFQKDVFSLNKRISTGLNVQYEVKKIIRPFANEIRSAEQSNQGAFPIIEASSSTIKFYSDIDNNGDVDLVRYFLDGTSFKKGVIKPSGENFSYNESGEKIIQIVNNVISSPSIFSYYDSSYTGSSTSTPLAIPVAPIDIRLIKVNLIVDNDGNGINPEAQISTQVTLRNLKDTY